MQPMNTMQLIAGNGPHSAVWQLNLEQRCSPSKGLLDSGLAVVGTNFHCAELKWNNSPRAEKERPELYETDTS
jgi:hypothetical protein